MKKVYVRPMTMTIGIDTGRMLCGSTGTSVGGDASIPALSRDMDMDGEESDW